MLLFVGAGHGWSQNWPSFRGPHAGGVALVTCFRTRDRRRTLPLQAGLWVAHPGVALTEVAERTVPGLVGPRLAARIGVRWYLAHPSPSPATWPDEIPTPSGIAYRLVEIQREGPGAYRVDLVAVIPSADGPVPLDAPGLRLHLRSAPR